MTVSECAVYRIEFFASVFTDEKTGELPEVYDMLDKQEGNRLSDVCIFYSENSTH